MVEKTIMKCSVDSAPEKGTCCYSDGTRKAIVTTHQNGLINMNLVCSFKKEDYDESGIAFAFSEYVFGGRTHRWIYENKEQRDADFEKLLKLYVHQL